MRLWPLALGVVACVYGGVEAAAQQMPAVEAHREFTGSLSLRGVYDSNFARSNSLTAASRGIAEEDYSLTPTLTARVVQPIGQQIVYLNGNVGYNFYQKNDQLNRARGDVQGGYVTRVGPCGLYATGAYAAAQSDLAVVDAPSINNLLKASTIGVGAQCGRRGLMGGLSAQESESKNSAAIQKQGDSNTESLSAQIGYGNATLGTVALLYTYSSTEYPNVILPSRPVGDGFFTQTIGVSAQRKFGSKLMARASAGRTSVKREFAPLGADLKFSSSNYAVGVDYLLGSRLNLSLSADRAVVPAGRVGKLYDIRTAARISGTYKLGSRFIVGFGHNIEDVDSNADTSLPFDVITNSRTNSSYASLRYQQSKRASLSLDVRYDDRNANLKEFNYSGTRVGVTAEVGF